MHETHGRRGAASLSLLLSLVLLGHVLACGASHGGDDDGDVPFPIDASGPDPARDAGATGPDASLAEQDAGGPGPDAGLVPAGLYPIVLLASDEPAELGPARAQSLMRVLTLIQTWFDTSMGATYALPAVEVLQSRYSLAEWETFQATGYPDPETGALYIDCVGYFVAWNEFSFYGLLGQSELPELYTPGVTYSVIAPAGGCGAEGLSVVEVPVLDRIDAHCPNARYDGTTSACDGALDPWCAPPPLSQPEYACAAVGALAHEIGHSFGLPHCSERPTCTGPSIMDEWWEFERGVTLSMEDQADLAKVFVP